MADYLRHKKKPKPKIVIKKKLKPTPALQELSPHQIVRYRDAEAYFGFKHAQMDVLIKAGKIPAPIRLTEGGKASGWLGQTILDYHRKLLERSAKAVKTPEAA